MPNMSLSKHCLKSFVACLLTLLAIICWSSNARAQLDVYSDVETAAVQPDGDLVDWATINGVWTQQRFNWQTKEPNPASHPTLVTMSPGWGYCIRFDLPGTPTNHPGKVSTDKTELNMVHVHSGPNPIRFRNDPNYPGDYWFGLTFRLASNYWLPAPDKDTMFFQLWQGFYSPPLTLTVPEGQSYGSTLDVELHSRNDSIGHNHVSRKVLTTFTFKREKWYDVVFRFKPSYNGDGQSGQIYVYINGNLEWFDANEDIGYNPDPSVNPDATDTMAALINLYRPTSTKRARVFIDNFRHGNSSSAVLGKVPASGLEPY